MDTLNTAIQFISKRKAIEPKSTPRAGKRAKKAFNFNSWLIKPDKKSETSPKEENLPKLRRIDAAHLLIDEARVSTKVLDSEKPKSVDNLEKETKKIADDIVTYDVLYRDLEQNNIEVNSDSDSPDTVRVPKVLLAFCFSKTVICTVYIYSCDPIIVH